ncbi:MAG: hypothetical protein M1820_004257 [Bogoriella megaspora]|nr:MAG: hypothetical protein M1820_004257 [Bogoriella megaspora]
MDRSTELHNYANPTANLAVATLLPVLGTFAVAVRFALQFAKKLPLHADDWLCIPALVSTQNLYELDTNSLTTLKIFVWACGALAIWGVSQESLGHHTIQNANGMADMNNPAYLQQMFLSHKLVFVFNILAYPALCFTKLSVLFFYRRIFRGAIFNVLAWFFVGFVISWTLFYQLFWIFSCGTHFSYWWGTIQQVHDFCLNIFEEMIAASAIDFILDISILCLPIVKIWQLQMPIRQKIMVLGIFLTGLLSAIAGILRFVATLALANFGILGSRVVENHLNPDELLNHKGQSLGVSSTDWMGMVTIHIFWTMIEVGVALIAICLPLFRPGTLLRKGHWLQRWLGSFSDKIRSTRRSVHHSRGVSMPNAAAQRPIPLKSTGSTSKTPQLNADYLTAKESMQDEEVARQDFRDRYERLFPTTSISVEANPRNMV